MPPKDQSLWKDFAGGVDPFGEYTFHVAKRNELANSKRHTAHKTSASAGGILGGAFLVTPLLTGMVESTKGLFSPSKGFKQVARTAGRNFIKGAVDPFKSIYHGVKIRSGLRRASKGLPMTEAQRKSAQKMGNDTLRTILQSSPLDRAAKVRIARKFRRGMATGLKNLHTLPPARRKMIIDPIRKTVDRGLGGAATAFLLSAGLSGASSWMQYRGGQTVGKEIKNARNK